MFLLPFVYWLCVHSHLSTLEQSFMGYKIRNVTLLGIALQLLRRIFMSFKILEVEVVRFQIYYRW
jgi:hypothetical protein